MFILPKIPSFGERFGESVTQGLSKGVDLATKLAAKKMEKGNIFEDIQKFRNSNSQISDSNSIQDNHQNEPLLSGLGETERVALASQYPQAMRYLQNEEKQNRKETFSREQSAEKELLQAENTLRSLKNSNTRFERLEELSSPEHEVNFPKPLLAAIFTKNGELNPKIQSQLSEDAQEFSKIIADELEGVKGMVGSRVTNYDIQAYMKRLPGLINSPEGRRRVLRDLKLMNQLNREYHEGLLDYVDAQGGVGKKSLSSLTRNFNKQFSKKEEELRKQFVAGDKHNFNELPDPSTYKGAKIQDEDTGEIFVSDGNEWHRE